MKTKPALPKKNPAEPRLDCRPTNYSEGALKMMEQATGLRYSRPPAPAKPPAHTTDSD